MIIILLSTFMFFNLSFASLTFLYNLMNFTRLMINDKITMEKIITHDGLQKVCFDHLWNRYPTTRRTFWHTPNEQRRYPGETAHHHMLRLSQAKSIGVLKGVVDLVWYWKGVLYEFDIKLGNDRLSEDQLKFIEATKVQGAMFFEIDSLESFQKIVKGILSTP